MGGLRRYVGELVDQGAETRYRALKLGYRTRSFAEIICGFGIHQYLMAKACSQGWSLLVVKEHWWNARGEADLRSTEWAKPLTGSRAHILDWLRGE